MASAKKSTTKKPTRIPTHADPEGTSDPNHRQVRLKPYNPRAGFVLRRYMYRGMRFETGSGWSTVPLSAANYLSGVRSREDDPNAPHAFTIATIEEATAMQEKEYEAAVLGGRIKPGDSPVMKPRDPEPLRPGTDPEPVTQDDLVTADLRRREDYTPPAERHMRGIQG